MIRRALGGLGVTVRPEERAPGMGHAFRGRSGNYDAGALPRILLIVVPQTGQVPRAIRRPESLTRTSPW